MQHQRAKPYDVTPQSEDAGLFRAGVCNVMIDLVPVIRRNSRQDLVVTGFVGDNREVSVTFAGRRMPAAKPLVQHLEQQRSIVRKRALHAGKPPPDVHAMRLPTRIEGTWRKKVRSDADGWQVNSYELVAAQWTIVNSKGEALLFGKPPVV